MAKIELYTRRAKFGGLDGDPSATTATPSGSSAFAKNVLLAAKSLTPNLTWSNMDSPEEYVHWAAPESADEDQEMTSIWKLIRTRRLSADC